LGENVVEIKIEKKNEIYGT